MKQSRQKTIGINPLELYLSGAQPYTQEGSPEQLAAQTQEIIQELQAQAPQEIPVQQAHVSPAIEVLECKPTVTVNQDALEVTQAPCVDFAPAACQQAQQTVNTCTVQDVPKQVVYTESHATTIIDELHAQELNIEDHTSSKKQRVTIHIPEELIDKVKNAVYWEPGLTLAGFAQYALARTLEQFEHERGAPFPDRKTRQLRGGRPIK
ncbi:hypothetical protein H0X48_02940 [Candidatus Dependentiae bacterium]|nr:hypothetical protein [Candidatus Dependentiae bacterium]